MGVVVFNLGKALICVLNWAKSAYVTKKLRYLIHVVKHNL